MEKHRYVGKTKEEAINLAKEELQEVEENLFIKEIEVIEKMDNFVNGLGFQNSEEAFYKELAELQKEKLLKILKISYQIY